MKLVVWALLTSGGSALIQGLIPAPLSIQLAVGLVVILAVLLISPGRFILLASQARWLFLSIVVLGVLATPGLVIESFPWASVEGLWRATSQVVHLLFALAMVAVLMTVMTRAEFIKGITNLAGVFRPLGLDPVRLATRLRLTLDYAEARLPQTVPDADTTLRSRPGIRR